MLAEPLQQWTDRKGITHRVRVARELSTDEHRLLTALHQQTASTVLLLEAGYHTPAIRQAPLNMMRLMLRILLPHVAEEEIAAFESSAGNALLIDWWAVAGATLPSV